MLALSTAELEKRTGEEGDMARQSFPGDNYDMQETAFIIGIRCECSAESTTTPQPRVGTRCGERRDGGLLSLREHPQAIGALSM
jgi:hypothetical protein